MKPRELIRHWQTSAKGRLPRSPYAIYLDVEAAARLAALVEMNPKRPPGELLGALLGAALEELEASMPYVQGSNVVTTNEMVDPLYEERKHAIGKTENILKAA